MLSDFLYRAPTDKMVKLLLERNVPVYYYVLNTTVEAFRLPEWRKYAHDNEYFFLTGAPFMDTEFFPKKLRLERTMWTDNDRNMSHFFMKTFTDFARKGNPTPFGEVLGIHFDRAINGELRYLNINTTFNSSILLNYRQTENAFWSEVSLRIDPANTSSFKRIFLVSSNDRRHASANISTVDRVLVGAEGAAANRFLEHVDSVSHPTRAARHVLHSVAQRKEVWTRGNR